MYGDCILKNGACQGRRLHPHSEQAQEHTRQLSQPRAGFPTADGDTAGLGEDLIHVLLQATAGIFAVEDRATLIVELEAAVVHIHRADNGNFVICKHRFSVQEAGPAARAVDPPELSYVGGGTVVFLLEKEDGSTTNYALTLSIDGDAVHFEAQEGNMLLLP